MINIFTYFHLHGTQSQFLLTTKLKGNLHRADSSMYLHCIPQYTLYKHCILNACLHSSKILSACYLIYWCHQKSQDSWRASWGTTIKAERRCVLLWYQHYHIPHGLGFQKPLWFLGQGTVLSWEVLLPREVQQALLLKNGVLWRRCPQSQLVVRGRLRGALSHSTKGDSDTCDILFQT